MEEVVDRIKGCVYGAALGDGFGLATEFMTKEQARKYYGNGPIKFGTEEGHPFVRNAFRVGWEDNDFTDDTDQMLLLVTSALDTGGLVQPTHFAHRLYEWAHFGFPELDKASCGIGFTIGSTIVHPLFRTNPHKAAYEVWVKGGRSSASNGAVMRTSALGIPHFEDEALVVRNAVAAAKVTHADPRSIFSAVVVSVLVSRMLRRSLEADGTTQAVPDTAATYKLLDAGCNVEMESVTVMAAVPKALDSLSLANQETSRKLMETFRQFQRESGVKEEWGAYQLAHPVSGFSPASEDPREGCPVPVTTKRDPAMDTYGPDPLSRKLAMQVVNDYKFILGWTDGQGSCSFLDELDSYTSIQSLSELEGGDIGYSLKCLAYGLYCGTRQIPQHMQPAQFFKYILTELALEGGDADTNGTVVGAILGCRLGFKALPAEWVSGLRHANYLDRVVQQLIDHVSPYLNPNQVCQATTFPECLNTI